MKLGTYITKLMTTVVDKEADDFMKNLAWDELKRLNADIEAFLRKNCMISMKKKAIHILHLLEFGMMVL